jgi:predicted phosphohydrolase
MLIKEENLPPTEQFRYLDCVIGGDECWLINPIDIKCRWNNDNLIFRSLILRKSDLKVINSSWKKFFNWSEQPDIEPFPYGKFSARAKHDGCCDGSVLIQTEDGVKSIKEICDDNYSGRVMGYDHEIGEICWTAVIERSIKNNNNDWYLLECEDGSSIKLTGNHMVWVENLKCYRKVSDLNGDEIFLLKKHDRSCFFDK